MCFHTVFTNIPAEHIAFASASQTRGVCLSSSEYERMFCLSVKCNPDRVMVGTSAVTGLSYCMGCTGLGMDCTHLKLALLLQLHRDTHLSTLCLHIHLRGSMRICGFRLLGRGRAYLTAVNGALIPIYEVGTSDNSVIATAALQCTRTEVF